MASVPNPRLIFNAIPKDFPIPGETTVFDSSETIDLENVPLNGGYLAQTLLVSPEPWLRERLRDPTIVSYSSPMKLGKPFIGICLLKVLRSEDEKVKVGEYKMGMWPWQKYTVHPWKGWEPAPPGKWPSWSTDIDAAGLAGPFKVLRAPGIPLSAYVGTLGTPGQTAYIGLKEYGNMKKGETIFVSTGAGSVGMVVIQLAKLAGLSVIASTGSDDKVKYLQELGVDHPFNYKTTPVESVLEKHGPIDIYWDNVGGSTLEAAIEHCNLNARIIACGYISEYNKQEPYGIKNLAWLFKKRIHIHGFILLDLVHKWLDSFYEEVPPLVLEGKLKTREYIVHGLENADKAWLEMFQGKNLGKTVVVVSEEED